MHWKNISMWAKVSQVSDVAHGPLVILHFVEDFFCRKKRHGSNLCDISHPYNMQRQLYFSKLFFFPGWRGGFTILN
jgi:hypothetical protein